MSEKKKEVMPNVYCLNSKVIYLRIHVKRSIMNEELDHKSQPPKPNAKTFPKATFIERKSRRPQQLAPLCLCFRVW